MGHSNFDLEFKDHVVRKILLGDATITKWRRNWNYISNCLRLDQTAQG